MIDFWLSAGLMLLAACAFVLLPLLRRAAAGPQQDRQALNVRLYGERTAELEQQHRQGILDNAALAQGQAEAARELLTDTDGSAVDEAAAPPRRRLLLSLLLAVAVPAVAMGLYLEWGSSDKLALTEEFRQPPQSLDQLVDRLQRTVKLQPESGEGWFLLGRAYLARQQYADAAHALEQAAQLSGRPPEVLGQWAQALYFANGRQLTPEVRALADEVLKARPDDPGINGLLGIAAFESRDYAEAAARWQRLADRLPPGDPGRQTLEAGVARARAAQAANGSATGPAELAGTAGAAVGGAADGSGGRGRPAGTVDGSGGRGKPAGAADGSGERGRLAGAGANEGSSAPVATGPMLRVRVSLAPELRDQVRPGDSLFVFARAEQGPPMPLAVKRLTVAQLPAEVTLSDSDAMMPQLKLSSFPRVRLSARISRSGDATHGEWIGESAPFGWEGVGEQRLVISAPDKR